MSKVNLEIWQSLEIFSRIVCKTEIDDGKSIFLKDFFDQNYLSRKLKKYDSRKLCKEVSYKLFGEKTDEDNHVVPNYPAGFYEFGRKIRLGEPVIVDEEVLDSMLAFINEGNNDVDIYSLEYRNYITPWIPSKKQHKLQDTIWWLYFYDRKYLGDGSHIDGLSKALLTFGVFGKAEISSFSPNSNRTEEYIGNYSMYGRDEKHVSLQLKLKRTSEKDLHILCYIGTDEITLALGQFHNIGRSIYSGTVIMEEIQIKNPDFQEVGFYIVEEKHKTNIPNYIWDYFKERKRNLMRTPCTITDNIELQRWLRNKN